MLLDRLSGCIGDEFIDMDNDGIEDNEGPDRDGNGWMNIIEIGCNSNLDNIELKPTLITIQYVML